MKFALQKKNIIVQEIKKENFIAYSIKLLTQNFDLFQK